MGVLPARCGAGGVPLASGSGRSAGGGAVPPRLGALEADFSVLGDTGFGMTGGPAGCGIAGRAVVADCRVAGRAAVAGCGSGKERERERERESERARAQM